MLLSWVRSSLVDSRDAIVVQRCLGSWEESGGMGMGDLDGFGGRTPSSFVNPSSSTRSSWRCVLLRRHQKPGRVGLCHQTGRIRKSLVSVRRPRQIPTQNGDRGTRAPADGGIVAPLGLGRPGVPPFRLLDNSVPRASLCDWSSPDSSSKLRPAFFTWTSRRLALLTEVLPSLYASLQQAQTLHARLFIVPSLLLARDSEPSPFLGLALPCRAGRRRGLSKGCPLW